MKKKRNKAQLMHNGQWFMQGLYGVIVKAIIISFVAVVIGLVYTAVRVVIEKNNRPATAITMHAVDRSVI